MKMIKTVLPMIGLLLLQSGVTYSCETYEQYTIDEIKEFRDMLGKQDADPLDRLFAFEKMACADRPTVRSYAAKEGLKTIKDPLVRNEIMLRALMQKTRVDVELGTGNKLTVDDKKFIAEHGGIYTHQVTGSSNKDGCISFYTKECTTSYGLFVSGDKVELNYKNVFGEFRLSSSGELVGTLRAQNSAKYTRIPAVIKLF